MRHLDLLSRLAKPNFEKIVLLVLDGVGDLATPTQPLTALQMARTPHLDALATQSSLGRIVPVATGITPGSGPGHLALFGYDPRESRFDIGRGILEALGLGLDLRPGRRCGARQLRHRQCRRLAHRPACRKNTDRRMRSRLREAQSGPRRDSGGGSPGRGGGGAPLRPLAARRGARPQNRRHRPAAARRRTADGARTAPAAVATAALVRRAVSAHGRAIADEPKANRVLLRGFSKLPHLPQLNELYKMRCGAFAGYPLYRGVASACGMTVIPCGKRIGEILDQVTERWQEFDFFFLHVKQTDQAGEDGNIDAKAAVDRGGRRLDSASPGPASRRRRRDRRPLDPGADGGPQLSSCSPAGGFAHRVCR